MMRNFSKIYNGVNICVDIRSTLKKTNTGIGRYTLNLIKALSGIDRKNNYYLYSRKKLFDFKRRLPELPGKNFRHVKTFSGIDALHTSSYDLERPKNAGKFIVTIHDIITKAYPYGHDEATIKQVDDQLNKVLSEADLLVADSYNTKSDLMKFYQIPDSKIRVIYPGVAERSSAQKHNGVAEPNSAQNYILFVGTLEPRKNVQGLIKAFNHLKKNLVEDGRDRTLQLYIVGMKGWMYEDIFKEYENSEFKKDIIFKGYVSENELAGLYKNALVFVYPSFYEGFGFPILEAFGYAVPVVTSRTSSCGEIARDGALLVDPDNYKEIGEGIFRIINSESLRQEMIAKGLNRAKEFTWEKTAREFLKLFTA
jgi:glycosyltransferase involved in cell wall biosynthesis